MVGIYKITNPNGKIYIGQSINILNRWVRYRYHHSVKNQPQIHRSISKYGVEKHIFEVLTECDLNQLDYLEQLYKKFYIAKLGWDNVLFCEVYDNGGGPKSNYTKKLISESLKGKPKPKGFGEKISKSQKGNTNMLGHKHTEETKKKMSKSALGRKVSKETRSKQSKSATGKIKTEEHRRKISESHPTKKSVSQFSLDNILLNGFPSINEASRQTGIRVPDISACCNGKQKTAQGYIWKFN